MSRLGAIRLPGPPLPAAVGRRLDGFRRSVAWRMGGIAAIGVKELRGRMRGRRAFAVLTVYLALLAGFSWMLYAIQERAAGTQFGDPNAAFLSARVGQSIFIGLLVLETLQIIFLAPASTAGAISSEREKQTIDLLLTTPIAPLSVVLGKLLSALAYILLLILASIPLTAIVFLFGGVGPESVVRGYLVLVVTALGFGSIGVFFSALVRRTQAATVLTYVTVLALTLGTGFLFVFWGVMVSWQPGGTTVTDLNGVAHQEPSTGRPPEALLWLNPFVADLDVICGIDTGAGGTCSLIAAITGQPQMFQTVTGPAPVPMPAPGVKVVPGAMTVVGATTGSTQVFSTRGVIVDGGPVGLDGGSVQLNDTTTGPIVDQPSQAGVPAHDTYWPRASLAWLVLSALLIWLAVRLISPRGRGWRRRGSVRSSRAPGGAPP